MGFRDKLMHAWNAFTNEDERRVRQPYSGYGSAYGLRPDRTRLTMSNERSILASALTRIGIDVSSVNMRHVKLDENERYVETIKSGLNNCLNVEANLDQAAQAFRQDMAMTLFDKGVIAIVPTETDLNPLVTAGYDVKTMRVGEVVQWYPYHVRVSVWNQDLGRREEITLPKKIVAIVENPLYAVMNEPNSTLQRLIRKLNILDAIDEQSGSGKLDVIIQLPYTIKSESRQDQAEKRAKDLEVQLQGSKYGVGYIDGTEKITQLNRPAENNLLTQIQYLTDMLYGQLGITEEVFKGTADEATMLNYYNRTIEPVLTAITEALHRTFLTKTARTQGQAIKFFRDPFKLVPISQLAEIADKFTRNEIASSNEIRGVIGWMPSKDPKADQLINSNMPEAVSGAAPAAPTEEPDTSAQDAIMEETFKSLEDAADDIINKSQSEPE